MARTDASIGRQQRMFRILLLAYPRAFRQVYGADMVQVFGDHLRDARGSRTGSGIGIWLHTLLDVFTTAPVERMEVRKMTREAFVVVGVALAIVGAFITMVLGLGGPTVAIPLVVLIAVAVLVMLASRKPGTVPDGPAPSFDVGQWWIVPAVVMAGLSIAMGVGMLIDDPKIENVFALGVFGGAGLLTLGGVWTRTRRRRRGDFMIAVGTLPTTAMFWMIIPPLIAITVMVMALVDATRARPADQPAL
jgi:hypothetical protein